jgi:hypothetical protein
MGKCSSLKPLITLALISAIAFINCFGSLAATAPGKLSGRAPQRSYRIRPVGLGSTISVVARSTRQLQVQVTDENDKPVPDLPVVFMLATSSLGTLAIRKNSATDFRPVLFYGPEANSAYSLEADEIKLRTFSDAQGKASVRFIAGSSLGAVKISATVEGTSVSWGSEIIVIDINEQAKDSSGTLTVAREINIDGNPVAAGTTVLSGSTISAGSQGAAVIDLVQLGSIELGPDTTIMLILSPGTARVKVLCDHARVNVRSGQANVLQGSGERQTASAGEELRIEKSSEVIMAGGTNLLIECSPRRTRGGGGWIGPGTVGILGLILAGVGIAVGIGLGDEEPGQSQVSPLRP